METSLQKHERLRNKSLKSNFVLVLLLFLFVALINYYNKPTSEVIKLWFFDVGQGDMEYIETPNSERIVIDGGPSENSTAKLDNVVPAYDKKIDTVILTHPHTDHLVGLIKLFKTYEIKNFYLTGATHTTSEYLELLNLIKEKNINTHIVKSGDYIDFGNGIKIEFLYPFDNLSGKSIENLNDSSIVARLTWGDEAVLYTGDVENEVQKEIIDSGQQLSADILKVSHHCSTYSANKEFIDAVSPEYAVISVGVDNLYGHPSQNCLNLLNNVKIYRTDQDGDIEFKMSKTNIEYVKGKEQ